MLLRRLPTLFCYLAVAVLATACSSGNSGGSSAVTGEGDSPPDVPTLPTGSDTILFPEMQGSWARACSLFDEEEPSNGYERSVVTVTGNDFVFDTKVYSDSNCITPLARGFLQFGDDFQSYGTLQRPVGTANTSVGAVPFIDIAFTRFTIDNQPLVPEAAVLNSPYTDYTIVYVDGNQMHLGDPDVPEQLGDSSQTRSVTLDFEDPLTRL